MSGDSDRAVDVTSLRVMWDRHVSQTAGWTGLVG
jgi:hypothetical protein